MLVVLAAHVLQKLAILGTISLERPLPVAAVIQVPIRVVHFPVSRHGFNSLNGATSFRVDQFVIFTLLPAVTERNQHQWRRIRLGEPNWSRITLCGPLGKDGLHYEVPNQTFDGFSIADGLYCFQMNVMSCLQCFKIADDSGGTKYLSLAVGIGGANLGECRSHFLHFERAPDPP